MSQSRHNRLRRLLRSCLLVWRNSIWPVWSTSIWIQPASKSSTMVYACRIWCWVRLSASKVNSNNNQCLEWTSGLQSVSYDWQSMRNATSGLLAALPIGWLRRVLCWVQIYRQNKWFTSWRDHWVRIWKLRSRYVSQAVHFILTQTAESRQSKTTLEKFAITWMKSNITIQQCSPSSSGASRSTPRTGFRWKMP